MENKRGTVVIDTPCPKRMRPIPLSKNDDGPSYNDGWTKTVTPPSQGHNWKFLEMRQFLQNLDLEEYCECFEEFGYDNINELCSLASNHTVMEKLSTTVGFQPGHAVRFQMALADEAKRIDDSTSCDLVFDV